jgi:hypothetical protein
MRSKKNIDQLNRDKIAARQNKVLDDILDISQKANDYLESGIDTAGIASQLDYILRLFDVAGDGVFTNKGTTQTERNLATTSSLLRSCLTGQKFQNIHWNPIIKTWWVFRTILTHSQATVFSLNCLRILFSLINLISKISVVTKEMRPADTLLKKAIQKVQLLQTRVNFVTVKLEDGIEQIEKYREDLAASLSDKETVNLWEPVAFRRPMKEILFLSKEKARFVLSFYSKNNAGKIVFLFLLIIGLAIFLRNLKKKLHAAQTLPADQQEYLVLGYPLLSSVLIVLCVFQFIFREPPFRIQCCIMEHFSRHPYFTFQEVHYQILVVCMVCNVDIIFPGNDRQHNTSVFPHRKIWNAIIVIDRCNLWAYFFNWWPRERIKRKRDPDIYGVLHFDGTYIRNCQHIWKV